MNNVMANPEDLRSFANHLGQYLEQLQSDTTSLQGHFATIKEVWNDAQGAAFEHNFAQWMAALRMFESNASEAIPCLIGMAQDLEQYLSR